MLKYILLVASLAGISTQATAKTYYYDKYQGETKSQFGLYAGYTTGGSTLDFTYTDGTDTEIDFGGLAAAGISLHTRHFKYIVTKLSAGYHFDYVNAQNGEAYFGRANVDALLGLRANDDLTIYAGVTYHISPKLLVKQDGIDNINLNYKDTLGYVAEVAFTIRDVAELSLRYAVIEYEYVDYNAEAITGDHLGLYFTRYF